MKRINPIYLLIVLNIVLIFFRDLILPAETSAALAAGVQSTLQSLGVFGYVGLVTAYLVCGFFFVPLLIPMNILGGALYGAYVGTAVALAGITVGTIASTIAARRVFTGMQHAIDNRPRLKRLLDRAEDYPNLTIALTRFAMVVPYLLQNIALAATKLSITRITIVTAVTAIPGAAIYSFLGAGLVRADEANELILYIAVPVALMLLITAAMAWFNGRAGRAEPGDSEEGD